MAEIERMTITLAADTVALVRGALDEGNYASSSDVIRGALRDWNTKRALQLQELCALKAAIDRGLADLVTAGSRSSIGPRDRTWEDAISWRLALRLTEAAETDLPEIWVDLASRRG